MSTVPTNLINVDLFPSQEAMAEQIQADYTQQAFQECSGAEILNTGLYDQVWSSDIHVSSMAGQYGIIANQEMALIGQEQELMEQHGMGQEQELIEYLGAAVQDTINNYNPTEAIIASHAAALLNINPPSSFMEELASVQPIGDQMAEMGYGTFVPMFELASNPTVSVEELRARIFVKNDDGEYVKKTDYLFDNIENRFKLMDFS